MPPAAKFSDKVLGLLSGFKASAYRKVGLLMLCLGAKFVTHFTTAAVYFFTALAIGVVTAEFWPIVFGSTIQILATLLSPTIAGEGAREAFQALLLSKQLGGVAQAVLSGALGFIAAEAATMWGGAFLTRAHLAPATVDGEQVDFTGWRATRRLRRRAHRRRPGASRGRAREDGDEAERGRRPSHGGRLKSADGPGSFGGPRTPLDRRLMRIVAPLTLLAALTPTAAQAAWPDDVSLSALATTNGQPVTNPAASRQAYETVVRELGTAIANKPMAPANTLGLSGFDVALVNSISFLDSWTDNPSNPAPGARAP